MDGGVLQEVPGRANGWAGVLGVVSSTGPLVEGVLCVGNWPPGAEGSIRADCRGLCPHPGAWRQPSKTSSLFLALPVEDVWTTPLKPNSTPSPAGLAGQLDFPIPKADFLPFYLMVIKQE